MKIRIKIVDLQKFVLVIAILITLLFTTSISILSKSNETDTVYNMYTVKTNDTLWSIASSYSNSDSDIRKIVYDIQKTNKIGDTICVGDNILIPAI